MPGKCRRKRYLRGVLLLCTPRSIFLLKKMGRQYSWTIQSLCPVAFIVLDDTRQRVFYFTHTIQCLLLLI